MFTMLNQNMRRTVSAVSAVAVVAFAGLTLDQGHQGAMPEGVVEVGEMQPYNLMELAAVTLPEIVVTAPAVEPGFAATAPVAFPEIIVSGKRSIQFAEAGEGAGEGTQG